MDTGSYITVLCFGVLLSAPLTMGLGSFKMELLMTKLDYLQDKLEEVEHTMQAAIEEMEQRLNTKLEDQMDYLLLKMHNMQLQLMGQTKTFQDTTQTSLDMLTDSVRNMSTVSEKSKKILEVQFMNPVRSCRQVTKLSSRYTIHVEENSKLFEVLCEQNKFDGGWTVIQHRFDGAVDFYRNWTEYRDGFGSFDGEFWLGLEHVHQITKNRPHELLVEVKDFHGNYGYAKYGEFELGSESEQFKLKKLGQHSGTAEDSMRLYEGRNFTTFDRDNDIRSFNCAEKNHGAWWYYSCGFSNLNGLRQNTTNDQRAMSWYHFKMDWRGMSYSRMMIRDIIN